MDGLMPRRRGWHGATKGHKAFSNAAIFASIDYSGNVWTITELLGESPIQAQIWFNSTLPGQPIFEPLVTPANQALRPASQPRVHLLKANNVIGNPSGGVKAFVRRTEPETTQVFEEDGKYIFAPGGNPTVFLSKPVTPDKLASGRVGFGGWEEKRYTL